MKIRVFEAFAGYGSQAMALKRIEINYKTLCNFEFVGISEIDKNAIKAYHAVHGDTPNYGDISTIDWKKVPDFDLFTYSFPCQDISAAGKQKGMAEGQGTRSSLLWECRNAIAEKKPHYLLMENVAALLGEKFNDSFQRWCSTLEEMGYTNYYKILNAKNYGVPQNRERVFMVSIYGHTHYYFPGPLKLKKSLKDVLENDVEEKYFLNSSQIECLQKFNSKNKQKGNGFSFQPKDPETCTYAGTILTKSGSRPTDNFIIQHIVLGWTRDSKGNVTSRHEVDVANCITSTKRDNTQNYIVERKVGIIKNAHGYNKGGYKIIAPTGLLVIL